MMGSFTNSENPVALLWLPTGGVAEDTEDQMIPDRLLGWTIENPGKRSHLLGTTDVVVGTSSPGIVTVAYSLCGTKGHGGSVQRRPNQTSCVRCIGVAFKLARKNKLPDID